MKPSETFELLARLQASYREEMTAAEQNLWVELLADAEAPAAFGAVEARIRSGDPFMPKVGEILAAIRTAGRPSGAEAWAVVLAEVRRVGYSGQPSFAEPGIERAVELMGWHRICNGDEGSPFEARDFERIYASVVEGIDRRAAFESGFSRAFTGRELPEIGGGE